MAPVKGNEFADMSPSSLLSTLH